MKSKYCIIGMVLITCLAGCGNDKEKEKTVIDFDTKDSETALSEDNAKKNGEEQDTADALLDAFLNDELVVNGSEYKTDDMEMRDFKISDLDIDEEDIEAYSIGERVDLDNDGENELIINNMYGGIYLDARDGGVYIFAMGDCTANMLSYLTYHDATWILYRNALHSGLSFYRLENYQGGDNLVEQFSFHSETDGGVTTYFIDDDVVSEEEYNALYEEVFSGN